MKSLKSIPICVLVVVISLCGLCAGATISVGPDADYDFTSIQAAIASAAESGDEIVVAPGTYYEAINFNGKAVHLVSSDGTEVTIIDGTGHYHVVQCVSGEGSGTILEGFTITGGNANGPADADKRGGGMVNLDSSPTVTNCVFVANKAKHGAGMYNDQSSPTITDCVFEKNTTHNGQPDKFPADTGGCGAGMYNVNSSPTVSDCLFKENATGSGGKGASGKYRLFSTGLAGYTGGDGGSGAGMYNDTSHPAVTGCDFNANVTGNGGEGGKGEDGGVMIGMGFDGGKGGKGGIGGSGGGMYNCNQSSPVVSSCHFTANRTGTGGNGGDYGLGGSGYDPSGTGGGSSGASGNGGDGGQGGTGAGMFNQDSSPAVSHCTFTKNVTGRGGHSIWGVYKYSRFIQILTDFTGGNISGGFIGYGGGGGDGAGMYTVSGSPAVTACTFGQNATGTRGKGKIAPLVDDFGSGAGMYNAAGSHSNVTSSTFSDNVGYSGGGMFNAGSDPEITYCTFRHNLAYQDGGAIFNDASGPIMTGCLFLNNVAHRYGSAIYNTQSSPVVTNCTLKANVSYETGEGRGINNIDDSNPVLTNCILWDNTPGEIKNDLSEPVVTCCNVKGGYSGTGNINVDPLFSDSLGRLSSGSPCTGTGDNSAPNLPDRDLDGNPRIIGSFVDLGAFEHTELPIHNVTKDTFYDRIQIAIADANDLDQIRVLPGTYAETIDFLGKALHLYSSDGPQVTIINGTGHYHVVQCVSGEGANTILDGFTLTGGNANGPTEADKSGGGMVNYSSSPTVKNCIFHTNAAVRYGGGMHNDNSSPTVDDCSFLDNMSTSHGGGIYNVNSRPTVINCRFSNNLGGLHGGGMMNNVNSHPTVTNCLFSQNVAEAGGGGMANSVNSNPTVTNCTFANNNAGEGGGLYNYASTPTLTNCIVWANWPNQISDDSSSPAVSYSSIQGGFAGVGNLDADPLFMDAAAGNLRLGDNSPCIDAGNNSAVPADLATDLDGDERFRDGNLDGSEVVDMGAFEYDGRVLNATTQAVYGTVQYAITGANHGDRVVVMPGIYYERINFSGKHIALSSIDPNDPAVVAETILDGQRLGRVVTFENHEGEGSACLLDGMTIRNGYSQEGAGIYCFQSSPTIRNCILRGNVSVGFGSVIWVEQGVPSIIGCTISNNTVHSFVPDEYSGTLVFLTWDDIVLKDCTIHNNRAAGGAIRFIGEDDWFASLTLVGCSITENVNPGRLPDMFDPLNDGGGIYFGRGRLFIEDCYIAGNRTLYAYSSGGGLWVEEAAFLEISGSSIINNHARGNGGGIGILNGHGTIDHCEISGNFCYQLGGGLYNYYGEITNSTIRDNTSRSGGGGLSGGYAAIANSVFTNNSSGSGGGLSELEGSITNCLILANRATSYGGGLYNCTAALTNTIIRQNIAEIDGDQLYGGSVPNYSNIQDWAGGGVGNITLDPSFRAPGVWVDHSDPNLVVAPDDPNAVWLEGSYRLRPGSPCIDAGNNAAVPTGVTTDLNGWSRFIDDLCTADTGSGTAPFVDMGPYEFLPADMDGSGRVNFADFGVLAAHWQQSGADCAGADTNCDGVVNLADVATLVDWWLEGT